MSHYYLQFSVIERVSLKVQIYTKEILKSEEKGRKRSKRIAMISALGVSGEGKCALLSSKISTIL